MNAAPENPEHFPIEIDHENYGASTPEIIDTVTGTRKSDLISKKCIPCNLEFDSNITHSEHAWLVHEKEYFQIYENEGGSLTYVCKFQGCGKSFKRKTHARRHAKTHSDEKPFRCELCPKAFTRKDNLKAHIRSHERKEQINETGKVQEKVAPTLKHACKECGRRFPTPTHVTRHMRTHTGEKPFVCPQFDCQRAFSRKDNMMHHYRKHLLMTHNFDVLLKAADLIK
ncbi:hypothetical protein ROZALSC1DRAFT_29647 [Rozella allomycis CSF55]|uniref:Zinc finger, C2H2 domain-containing protein n=1 Tax=Rozella allomycis (strain CSF55) TaxID=988480 RepID=A0A075B4R0_ROZAC|nr:Zinc finger, C2H2 domain-containing protein [Rozella allomycis CSF55]RKP18685.1 hypothetical protein ROZALSC1DRAFT_29647 [Rozella allomycis CSF55]|eukprot:EPZ36399.1 Zinc finger, C2H2 domain-containing protein [Rozella allomycis CSF55]